MSHVLSCALAALLATLAPAARPQSSVLTDTQRLALYAYDRSLPLAAEIRRLPDQTPAQSRLRTRYHVVYGSTHAQRVPAIFTVPKAGKAPHPAVVLLAGSGGHKDTDYVRFTADMLSTLGYATISIDAQYHGERSKPGVSSDIHMVNDPQMRDAWIQTVVDLRRAVDYLASRRDVDARRIAFMGFSQGSMVGGTFIGVEPRIVAACLAVGGGGLAEWGKTIGIWPAGGSDDVARSIAETDPIYFVGRLAPRPLLMLSAEKDELIPRAATEALYNAAGQPKEIVWFNSGHVLPPNALLVNARGFFRKLLQTAKPAALSPAPSSPRTADRRGGCAGALAQWRATSGRSARP